MHKLLDRVRKQDGFTLIELIVVVAILGILAAVLTPRVLDAIENAKENAGKSSAKQIQLAMERYFVNNNFYPAETAITTPAQLVSVLGAFANIDENNLAVDATGVDNFDYQTKDKDGADNTSTNTNPAKSYTLTLVFKDSGIKYEVTPSAVAKK